MPAVTVRQTPIAARQVAGLRGPALKSYESFLDDLSATGCESMGYRLTGSEPLPRLCVKHLRGPDRVVVAFDGTDAWVLLVGPHRDSDPGIDVYQQLYRFADAEVEDFATRSKPPCCDADGDPPQFTSIEVDDLVARAKSINKRDRR